jgi:hypothetical protein
MKLFGRPCYGVVSLGIMLLTTPIATAQISLGGLFVPYNQDFNSLANAGLVSSTVPTGWQFVESGPSADTNYRIFYSVLADGTADTYSFGDSSSTDRAFGAIASSDTTTFIGASFINGSASPITEIGIAYTGEQWWRGSGADPDLLQFSYSLDATSLTSGTWTNVSSLDFYSPNLSGANVALNGNADGNRSDITLQKIAFSTPLAPGETFFIRWQSINVSGNGDGLAIDDFTIMPTPEPTTSLALAGVVVGAVAFARRRRNPAVV